jgi:hypothetical protein
MVIDVIDMRAMRRLETVPTEPDAHTTGWMAADTGSTSSCPGRTARPCSWTGS